MAIVTGAAHGIGRAISECFAEEGARVTLVDVDAEAGEAAAAAIRDGGGDARFCRGDVSSIDDVGSAVDGGRGRLRPHRRAVQQRRASG